MSRAVTTRDAWHPQTRETARRFSHELHEVLASPHFSNSKRYPALLQYIVENTLAGKSELLKERTLGVEVFDRPPTYDTNADTVVRYTAGEVRKRLLLYYSEHGRGSESESCCRRAPIFRSLYTSQTTSMSQGDIAGFCEGIGA